MGASAMKKAAAIAAIMVVSAAIGVIISVDGGASKGIGVWMRIAYMLLGVSISFFVIMIVYIIHTLIITGRRGKEERIKGILKEAKKIEERIKEEGLTSATDIILSEVLDEIRSTRSVIVSLILFGIGILFSLGLAIMAMLLTFT